MIAGGNIELWKDSTKKPDNNSAQGPVPDGKNSDVVEIHGNYLIFNPRLNHLDNLIN